MNGKLGHGRYLALAAAVMCAGRAWGAVPASAPGAKEMAAEYFAGVLANDARDALRNPDLPTAAAATQAEVLLRYACAIDGTDLRHLHLLAETARVAGIADVQKETLRRIIKTDPGDLIAQEHYIDLLATDSQTLEDRARIYQAALGQAELDPQIKSEMALRLAHIYEERGNTARMKEFLAQALLQNHVNVAALRDVVQLAAANEAPGGDALQMTALAGLLMVNPYQSDAWRQAARLCSAANVHDRAAEFLRTALEQSQMDGMGVGGDALLELTLEQAIAGKRGDAFQNANALAQLPDAPIEALLVVELLAQDKAPGSGTVGGAGGVGGAATQSAADKWLPEIRKRLAEMVKAAGTNAPSMVADAVGIDLTMLPAPGAETAGWLEEYAKRVPADDPTLARLRAWKLYREGKLDDAMAAFLKIAGDPLAQLGRARILMDQGSKAKAAEIVQEMYATYPTGLLALQVARAAQDSGALLAESERGKALREAAAGLTATFTAAHRQPRDLILMGVTYRKTAVSAGEPVTLTIRMTNVSERPLPVGADGVMKTTVALAGALRTTEAGAEPVPLGLFAVEDLQRVHRLEPHQSMEWELRADQGELADRLEDSYATTYRVGLNVLTAPRVVGAQQYSVGAGGLVITMGNFERAGMPAVATADDLRGLVGELSKSAGDKLLIRVGELGAIRRRWAGDVAHPGNPLIEQVDAALTGLAKSDDPLTRAAVARANVVDGLGTDRDPLVRLMAAEHLARELENGGDAGKAARATLQMLNAGESDEEVKRYIEASLKIQTAERGAAAPAKEAGAILTAGGGATAPATAPGATTFPADPNGR